MKKIFLFWICISFLLSSNAQLTKDNWLVGGSGGFTLFKTRGTKETYLQLSPNIGYFFFDKFGGGLKLSYTFDKTTSTGSSFLAKSSGFYVGPFVRYYFLNANKPFNILLEGSYQHGFEKGGDRYTTTKYNINGFSFVAGPVIYFNSSVGLEFLGGYEQRKYTSDNFYQSRLKAIISLQVHLEKE